MQHCVPTEVHCEPNGLTNSALSAQPRGSRFSAMLVAFHHLRIEMIGRIHDATILCEQAQAEELNA